MRQLFLALMLMFCASVPSGADDRQPERDWARGIVKDFFNGAFQREPSALGLLSPELARGHERLADFYPLSFCDSFHIISEHLGPNNGEVIFRGNLLGGWWASRPVEGGPARAIEFQGTFMLRVAKEPSGRWSIRYVRLDWINKTGLPGSID